MLSRPRAAVSILNAMAQTPDSHIDAAWPGDNQPHRRTRPLTLQTSATGDFAENKSKREGAMTKSGQNAEFQAADDRRYRAKIEAKEEDLTEWCVS
jgi:hypothetical protein